MKVACIQINSGSDMTANITRCEALVREAAGHKAELIALPENVFCMEEQGAERVFYGQDTHPGVAASINMAKAYAAWLLVGSVAIKTDESGKTLNRSLLINPKGEVAAHYDKIHLFDVTLPGGETYAESSRMLAGNNGVIASLPGARLGMTICYDVRFPHLYRSLAKAGADILAVPAAFTQTTGEAHWQVLMQARAIENGCYVIAPAQTGTSGKRRTFGHALIVDPWGRIIADAGVEEGVITADLDMQLVKDTRARIPSLQHDRPFGFEDL